MEKKVAVVTGGYMIRRVTMKGESLKYVVLFFKGDNRTFISYLENSKKIKELIGYECEYTVCTSIFGLEFIKDIPVKTSNKKVEVKELKSNDLVDSYYIDYSFTEKTKDGILLYKIYFITIAIMTLIFIFAQKWILINTK